MGDEGVGGGGGYGNSEVTTIFTINLVKLFQLYMYLHAYWSDFVCLFLIQEQRQGVVSNHETRQEELKGASEAKKRVYEAKMAEYVKLAALFAQKADEEGLGFEEANDVSWCNGLTNITSFFFTRTSFFYPGPSKHINIITNKNYNVLNFEIIWCLDVFID